MWNVLPIVDPKEVNIVSNRSVHSAVSPLLIIVRIQIIDPIYFPLPAFRVSYAGSFVVGARRVLRRSSNVRGPFNTALPSRDIA